MIWLRDSKLSSKLIAAFGACALITLAVGWVGDHGIRQLSDGLDAAFSNNLVSVAQTAETRSRAIAQQRDLYRYVSATAAGAPQSTKDDILNSIVDNRVHSEKAFAVYRATPLDEDERAASDKLVIDWPAYQDLVHQVLSVLQAGDVVSARAMLAGSVQKAYDVVLGEMNIIIDSNNRQIDEGADEAASLVRSATAKLYVGIALAFVAALLLGVFISRLISRPLAAATGEALQQIAQGIGQINDRNLVIASACEEQVNVAREVDRNLTNIQELSTRTAAGAYQTTTSSQDLSRLAFSFNALVKKFKL